MTRKPLSIQHKLAISKGMLKKRYDYDPSNPPNKKHLRRWLIEDLGKEACSICDWAERRKDGRCPLQIDHIDGNHNNWSWTNLRLLCPNCHSLTPSYMCYGRKLSPDHFASFNNAGLIAKQNKIKSKQGIV